MYHNRYKYMCHVCVCSYSIYFCIYCIIILPFFYYYYVLSIRFSINIVVEWIITLNYNSITDGVYMLLEKVV